MFRRVTTFILTVVALTAAAIPNWGVYTDGIRNFEVRGNGQYFSFYSDRIYMSLSGGDGEFYVDPLESDTMQVGSLKLEPMHLPEGVTSGDKVLWINNGYMPMMLFYNQKGEVYTSWKINGFHEKPQEMRRKDSLLLIRDGLGNIEEQTVVFQPDVIHQGRVLMHIKTGNQHLLFELTATGTNVYRAIWNKAQKKYVRGSLLRRIKQRPLERLNFYSEMPFADLLVRYCPRSIYEDILKRFIAGE